MFPQKSGRQTRRGPERVKSVDELRLLFTQSFATEIAGNSVAANLSPAVSFRRENPLATA